MSTNREDVDSLIEDLTFLQDELEALKYVISAVPYTERPPGGNSIMDMIALIKEQQEQYYRPLVENTLNNKADKNRQLSPVDDEYQLDEDQNDIDSLLNKTIKKRASFINLLGKISTEDWNRDTKAADKQTGIATLIRQQIEFDRKQLKKVAEHVMALEKTRMPKQQ